MRIDEIKQEVLNILDDRGFRRDPESSGVVYKLESDPTLRARVLETGIQLVSRAMHVDFRFQQYNMMRSNFPAGMKRFNFYLKESIRKHTRIKEAEESYISRKVVD